MLLKPLMPLLESLKNARAIVTHCCSYWNHQRMYPEGERDTNAFFLSAFQLLFLPHQCCLNLLRSKMAKKSGKVVFRVQYYLIRAAKLASWTFDLCSCTGSHPWESPMLSCSCSILFEQGILHFYFVLALKILQRVLQNRA